MLRATGKVGVWFGATLVLVCWSWVRFAVFRFAIFILGLVSLLFVRFRLDCVQKVGDGRADTSKIRWVRTGVD